MDNRCGIWSFIDFHDEWATLIPLPIWDVCLAWDGKHFMLPLPGCQKLIHFGVSL